MATPIGHALFAAALARGRGVPMRCAHWRWYLFAVFAANAPDLDFLPGLVVGEANRFHQLGSHSLAAALTFGLLAAASTRCARDPPARLGLWAGTLYASHLLLDWLTLDTRAPYGIPLLWPFSDRHFSAPFSLFVNVRHGSAGGFADFFGELVSTHNLRAVAVEILLLLPVLAVASVPGARRRRAALPPVKGGEPTDGA